MIENISVVIIVKEGEKTIQSTLDALSQFSDVVVYDNGSTDNTIEIVKKYRNVNLVQGDFLGFGMTKNKAATYSKHDWVLSLDADEVLSQELLVNLLKTELDKNCVYVISRENYYQKKSVKYCWGNDKIVRLYNKQQTKFNDNILHESVVTQGLNQQKLTGVMRHYPYTDVSGFLQKTDSYSTLYAQQNQGKKTSSPFKAFYKSTFHFIKLYFLKLGFLDGYAGLLVSVSGANGVFFKYLKLYELNKKQ